MTERDSNYRLSLVLTATIAAQLATLPVLLPVFGTISLMSVPANIVAVPLVAIAMPLAALAAIAGSFWPPLGEAIAAPAILAATALIRSVDVLAAPGSYVSVGVPSLPATAAIAATVSILLLLIAGDEVQGFFHLNANRAGSRHDSAAAHTFPNERVKHPCQLNAMGNLLPNAGRTELLPSSAVYIFTEEDPVETSTADPRDAIPHPASDEVGLQLSEAPRHGDVGHTEKAET